jgi:hypothetical protein
MRQHGSVLLWFLLTGLLLSTVVTVVFAADHRSPQTPKAPAFWQPREYQPTAAMREKRARARTSPNGRLTCHPTRPLLTTPSR